MNIVWSHMIHERASICFRIKRPSNCMLNIAWLMQLMTWFNLPYFFESDSIKLRVNILSKIKFLHNFLWKRASCTLSENSLFSNNLNTTLKILFYLSFFGYSKVSSCDAFYTSIIIIKDLRTRGSRKYINTQLLSSFTHPSWYLT